MYASNYSYCRLSLTNLYSSSFAFKSVSLAAPPFPFFLDGCDKGLLDGVPPSGLLLVASEAVLTRVDANSLILGALRPLSNKGNPRLFIHHILYSLYFLYSTQLSVVTMILY